MDEAATLMLLAIVAIWFFTSARWKAVKAVFTSGNQSAK
jgi:hypothetical protein